jgi:hypothetical protein
MKFSRLTALLAFAVAASAFAADAPSAFDSARKTAEIRAREAVEIGGDVAQARMKLGENLASKGDYAAALAEFLWCFDKGTSDPAFVGVRLSFLLLDLQRLGQVYPPALQAMRDRSDEREKKIISGTGDALTLRELVSLNDYLEDKGRSLSLYDRLPRDSKFKKDLGQKVTPQLLAARRYDDILQNADSQTAFAKQVEVMDSLAKFLPDNEIRKETLTSFRKRAVDVGLAHFEALAGTKKDSDALALADKIQKLDPSPAVREQLARAATRAGNTKLADQFKPAN